MQNLVTFAVNLCLVLFGTYLMSTLVGWNFAAGLAMMFLFLKGAK